MRKIARHEMYVRRLALVPQTGVNAVETALAAVGVKAQLIPLPGATRGTNGRIEIAVTGREEATDRAAISAELSRVDCLEVSPVPDESDDV